MTQQPNQTLQDILKYAVEKGYRVTEFHDAPDGSGSIEFLVNGRVKVRVNNRGRDYEIIINDRGGYYTKEVNDEALRKAAEEVVRECEEALKRCIEEFKI